MDHLAPASRLARADTPFAASFLVFLWRLVRLSRPANSWRDLGRSVEYVLRLLPYRHWVVGLRTRFSDPRLQPLLLAQPAIMDRVRRPYQNRRWGVSQRYQALTNHYDWLLAQFDEKAMAAIYQPGGWLVAEVQGTADVLHLHLLFDRLYDKEGELMLALLTSTGQRVATLVFSVGMTNEGHVMRIAGLQGGKDAGRDIFKQITKDCHGMRPLALLVRAAQELALDWGIQEVWAISHGQHIYQMWRYRYREIHRVQRSYDDLWQELGGIPQQGWYRLPQKPVEYDLGAIPSHKRAMYRRRQEMLVRLHVQLAAGQALVE